MNTTTVENNKLIAEFLGYEWDNQNEVLTQNKFAIQNSVTKFHSDWNWLMQLVEKIESLGFATSIASGSKGFACVITKGVENIFLSNNKTSKTKIEAVYNACVEFIKWYNQNK